MRGPAAGDGSRRTHRRFSLEFKHEAVALMRRRRIEGASLAQVARELDIGAGLLWEWERKLDPPRTSAGTPAPGETLEEENRRLRRENALLREEREFAKKALVFFARESP